jgi:ParB family chromosome partitioning protein
LQISQLDVTDLRPNPSQPRTDFDEEAIEALTASIKTKGVMHPLVAYRCANGGYELISGERRLRASARAGLRTVPVLLVEEPEENDKLERALIENMQRDDLKPLELANAFASLITERGFTHEEISLIVGKARSTVTNTLRLLELDPRVIKALEEKRVSEGHARVFLTVSKENIGKLLAAVTSKKLSVRATEAMAKQLSTPKKAKPPLSADDEALSKELQEYCGLRVSLRPSGKDGGGVIELRYKNIDELDFFINKIRAR